MLRPRTTVCSRIVWSTAYHWPRLCDHRSSLLRDPSNTVDISSICCRIPKIMFNIRSDCWRNPFFTGNIYFVHHLLIDLIRSSGLVSMSRILASKVPGFVSVQDTHQELISVTKLIALHQLSRQFGPSAHFQNFKIVVKFGSYPFTLTGLAKWLFLKWGCLQRPALFSIHRGKGFVKNYASMYSDCKGTSLTASSPNIDIT